MKGTAAVEPAPPAAGDRRCRKIIIHGLADGTVHPANGERILDQAERGQARLKRIDLDSKAGGGRVLRTVLEDDEGRTRAAASRKPPASTPPGSWCAFSCSGEDG